MVSPELRKSIGQIMAPVMGSRDGAPAHGMGMNLESTYDPSQP